MSYKRIPAISNVDDTIENVINQVYLEKESPPINFVDDKVEELRTET